MVVQHRSARSNPEIWRMGLFSASIMFISYLYFPLLSPFLKDVLEGTAVFGLAPETWLGIIFAAYPLAVVLGLHAMGALADDIGRLPVILFGLIINALALVIYLTAAHPVFFVLARAMEAFGHTGVLLIILAKVNDVTKEKHRGQGQGVFMSLQQIGTMIAPLVGGWLTITFFPETPFVVGLAISVLLIGVVLMKWHGPLKHPHKQDLNMINNWQSFLSFRPLKGMAILGMTMHASAPAFFMILPLFILERFPEHYGYVGLIFFFHAALKPFQFVSGWLVDHFGKKRLTILGCIIVGLSFLLIPVAGTITGLALIVLIMSAGSILWNMGAWTVMSDIGEANHIEGHVVGSYASIAKVGDFAGSLAYGAIAAALGTALVFSVSGFVMLVGVLVSLFFLKDKNE